ncbi:hypothetical protein [Treponema endosymbiont of Eucomonympha sp.]|uniref:hypothetical protein n=1 Tax=Treponema endosymbiont of Eucomonympha sp. TaxID=1580831 RepID=UPI000750C695|nr:hypothetical protein [Treponema endosymbiont of Eucomonympha sp.]
MTATYRIKPNEIDMLAKMLKSSFRHGELKITVETMSDEQSRQFSNDLARLQADEALEWEQSGKPPFRTMSVEELEAMI